jgi:hypothetical protein
LAESSTARDSLKVAVLAKSPTAALTVPKLATAVYWPYLLAAGFWMFHARYLVG